MSALPVVIRSSQPPSAAKHFSPLEVASVLWRHRALIQSFASRELLERHRGAILGVAWNILNPLLQLLIYTAVFGYLFGVRWERGDLPAHIDFPLVFFVGHTFMHVFIECTNRAPMLVAGRPNLVRKVVFPLEILPATVVASSMVYALIALGISMLVLVIATGRLPLTLVYAPLVALPLVMLALGAGWLLSAIGVFVRDMRHIVQVLTQLLMFATPVFYKLDRFEGSKHWVAEIIRSSPLAIIVENARRVILWGEPPEWVHLGAAILVAFVFMQLGYVVFMRLRPQMADVH